MIERLIASALRFRAVVIAGALVLVAAGTWALANLTVDAFPDLTPNQVDVLTPAPGLSPNEVENLVSYPVETAMMGLPRTTKVRSLSKAGISVVTVSFEDDVDLYFARAQVQQRMQDAMEALPEGIRPTLGPAATAMGEMFQYLVESDSMSLIELKNLQEYTIKPLLRTIPGVADISAWGGMVQEFQVQVDPQRLAGYGITLDDVRRAVGENNAQLRRRVHRDPGPAADGPRTRARRQRSGHRARGGRDSDRRHAHLSFVMSRASSWARCLAKARSRAMAAGEAVSGKVIMLKGSNGREVVRQVEERLVLARKLLPAGVSIRPYYSQGDVVDHTTQTVLRNLAEGGLLVVLVLFVFLRNVRASLIAASVIPLSLLFAFIAMKRFGVSANLMSLGALDFGLLVDASVVMVENFVRRLEQAERRRHDDRRSLFRAAASKSGGRSCSASASSSPSTCRSSRCRGSKAGCSRRWRSRCAWRCWGRCSWR